MLGPLPYPARYDFPAAASAAADRYNWQAKALDKGATAEGLQRLESFAAHCRQHRLGTTSFAVRLVHLVCFLPNSCADHAIAANPLSKSNAEGGSDETFVVVKFPERSGFANRVLALTSAFAVALVTNRTFLGTDRCQKTSGCDR